MRGMMTQNPKATEKKVVITLKIKADSMTEIYGRIAEIVKSAENSAEVVSVNVDDEKKINIHQGAIR
jgi:hypothetical protein